MFYNASNNTGWIVRRLKYVNSKQDDVVGFEGLALSDENDDELDDDVDLKFFKTFVLEKTNDSQCNLVKRNLKKTLKRRMQAFSNEPIPNILINFPCMLLNHELVRRISSLVFSNFYLFSII